jgi:hypothetical protein
VIKEVLAGALYLVGASLVLFVVYQTRSLPGSEAGYLPLYGVGMVLVVVAALLWPEPEGSGEEHEGQEDHDEV